MSMFFSGLREVLHVKSSKEGLDMALILTFQEYIRLTSSEKMLVIFDKHTAKAITV